MAPLPPPSVDFSTKTQAHSTLGTELWENKVAGSTVLTDVKKRKNSHVIAYLLSLMIYVAFSCLRLFNNTGCIKCLY